MKFCAECFRFCLKVSAKVMCCRNQMIELDKFSFNRILLDHPDLLKGSLRFCYFCETNSPELMWKTWRVCISCFKALQKEEIFK